MKKSMKIVSLTLALILAFSVFMIPVGAFGESKPTDISVKLSLGLSEVIGEMSDAGQKSEDFNVYKLTLKMDSNYKIPAIVLSIDYDKNLFTPIDHTGGDYSYLCDSEFVEVMYKPLGYFADTKEYNSSGVPVASRGTMFGLAHTKSTDDLKIAMENKDNTGNFLFSWYAGSKTIMPGNSQNEGLFDFYFVRNAGVTAEQVEGAKFSFNSRAQSVAMDAVPAFEHFYLNGVSDTYDCIEAVTFADYTYSKNPPAANPSVAKANSQVKFYGTKPTADDNFDYRLVSKIADADWDTYFAGTGAATGNNRITSVGFVAHDKKDGAMNLDTAKAVAKGTAAAGYKTASTTYISKANDTADATFGCLIKDIMHSTQATDIECLAYVQYVDGTGATQYIFYDAAINAAVNTGYANALAAWKAA